MKIPLHDADCPRGIWFSNESRTGKTPHCKPGCPFFRELGDETPMPDFDQIAQRVVKLRADLEDEEMREQIAEELRYVWNSRGTADLALLNTALVHTMEKELRRAEFDTESLTIAIRSLDH